MPERYTFDGSRCGTCRLPRATPVTGCDEHAELSRVTAILLNNAAALDSQDSPTVAVETPARQEEKT